MQVPANQIQYKKVIGKSKGRTVFGVGVVGGLHMVVAAKRGGGIETLGVASHPALARHIAERNDPGIEFTELAKSEQVDPRHFGDLVDRYVELTAQFRGE